MKWFVFGIVMVIGVATSESVAQLTWKTTEAYQEQSPDTLAFTARFEFENTGEYPLYIKRVKGRDREATATLIRRGNTIRPGETGAVVLSYPSRLLFDEKIVTAELVTDERANATTTLKLRLTPEGWDTMTPAERERLKAEGERIARLPEPVTVDRRSAVWRAVLGRDVALGQRTIEVRFPEGDEAEVKGLRLLKGTAERFETRIEEIESGRHYRIEIESKGTPRVAEGEPARSIYAAWELETTLRGDAKRRAVLDGPLAVWALILPEQPASSVGGIPVPSR